MVLVIVSEMVDHLTIGNGIESPFCIEMPRLVVNEWLGTISARWWTIPKLRDRTVERRDLVYRVGRDSLASHRVGGAVPYSHIKASFPSSSSLPAVSPIFQSLLFIPHQPLTTSSFPFNGHHSPVRPLLISSFSNLTHPQYASWYVKVAMSRTLAMGRVKVL